MTKENLNKKLVVTILARNEGDIIEETIKFHLNHGADFIIATDNNSDDNTRDIFLKYQKQGVLELIDEPDHNYDQAKWVHRMVLLAKEKYKADWVINIDADEFWYCNYGNLKLALPDPKKFNIVNVKMFEVDPIDRKESGFEIPKFISGIVAGTIKCIHTTKGYRHIGMGNHSVGMKANYRDTTETLDIIIFHFYARSYEQYKRKVINGTKALENNPSIDERTGSHIRHSYELYKQGKLEEEYKMMQNRYINHHDHIKDDNRLYNYIHNGYKSIESILFSSHDVYNGKNVDVLYNKPWYVRATNRLSRKMERVKRKKNKNKI